MRLLVRLSALSVPVFGSIVLLAGCATLSKEECKIGNWQTIGYNDGVAGHYPDRLASHAKACAKVGTAPDYQAWERGRQLGLQQYCTVNNAYNIGKRGNDLNSVCPAALTHALQQANQQGKKYYHLNKQLNEDKLLLEKYQVEYRKLREGEMLDFNNEKEARARLLFLAPELQRIERRIASTKTTLTLENQKVGF